LDRLLALRPVNPRRRGLRKATLEGMIKTAARNLADALFDQGSFAIAYATLSEHDPRSPRLSDLVATIDAIKIPDDQHCGCPATDQFIATRIYLPERTKHVDLVMCACGHRNATEILPAGLAALHKAG